MNPFFDLIEKLVTEHGSAAIRGERIAQLKEAATAFDLKLKDAQFRIETLERALNESGINEKNLEAQLIVARVEIKRLNQQSEDAKKLTAQELWILKFMSNSRDYVFAADMEVGLNIDGGRIDYLLGRLRDAGYIYMTGNVPARFKIEQKGMEAIF